MEASPVPNGTPYVSAPTSPTKCSLKNVCFYSVPTSPTRTHEDVSSKFGEIEFETSRYFDLDGFKFEKSQSFEYLLDHDQDQQQCGTGDDSHQPAMAFADELFCNGLVLPLKLPPRLQNVNGSKSGNHSSITAYSPRSPTPRSVVRLPFSRRTWNDGYDPFTAALENVKAEQKDLDCGSRHRRSRSLSPLRAITSQKSGNFIGLKPQASMPHLGPIAEQSMKQNGSASASNRAIGGSSKLVTNMPAKTKGVAGARRAASLKTGQVRLDSLLELAGHTQIIAHRDQERQRIKTFTSMGVESSKEKPRIRIEALWKPPPQSSRGWSFRKSAAAVHSCGKRRMYQDMKTVIQNRPSLFLCFGFGIRSPRNII